MSDKEQARATRSHEQIPRICDSAAKAGLARASKRKAHTQPAGQRGSQAGLLSRPSRLTVQCQSLPWSRVPAMTLNMKRMNMLSTYTGRVSE